MSTLSSANRSYLSTKLINFSFFHLFKSVLEFKKKEIILIITYFLFEEAKWLIIVVSFPWKEHFNHEKCMYRINFANKEENYSKTTNNVDVIVSFWAQASK